MRPCPQHFKGLESLGVVITPTKIIYATSLDQKIMMKMYSIYKHTHFHSSNISMRTFFYTNIISMNIKAQSSRNLRIILKSCKSQASLTLIVFVYSSYNTASKLTFALSIQYLLFCSTSIMLYDEVKHQQRFECISFIFCQS